MLCRKGQVINMAKRREARELAFQIVFEKEFTDSSVEDIITAAEEIRGVEFDEYAKSVSCGVYENIDQIDQIISKYSVARSIRRLSKVVLAVLRVAIYEILYVENLQPSISINEAVELTKTYATNEEGGFVNGVLGSFVRTEGMA